MYRFMPRRIKRGLGTSVAVQGVRTASANRVRFSPDDAVPASNGDDALGLDYPTQPQHIPTPSFPPASNMESPVASSSVPHLFPSSLNGRDSRRREEDLVYLFEAEEERITNLLSRKLEKVRNGGVGVWIWCKADLWGFLLLAQGGKDRAGELA